MSDGRQLAGPPSIGGDVRAAAVSPDTWAVVIPDARYEAERLFHHTTFELAGLEEAHRPGVGAQVLVVTEGEVPRVVALGRISPAAPGQEGGETRADAPPPLVVTYTCRAFDEPVPADGLTLDGPVSPVDPAAYRALAGRLAPVRDRTNWLVSLDLPIEAPSAAEAVRLFWSYVRELGPRELPTFVYPTGDELAMQAFVLGAQANQDPEED